MLIGVKKKRKEVALRNPNLQIFLLNHPNHMHPTPDYDNSNSKYGYIALQFMKLLHNFHWDGGTPNCGKKASE